MKLLTLIALPMALVADAVTFGEARMTKKILYNDECEQVADVLKEMIKIERQKQNDQR